MNSFDFIPKLCTRCIRDGLGGHGAAFCSGCGSLFDTALPSGALEPGTVLENRYKILNQIRTGDNKNIYKIKENRFDNIYVLKEFIPPDSEDPNLAGRFERAARFLGKLENSGFIKVYDYFSRYGRYYIVMDFIPGKDLETILDEEGNPGLPVEKVLGWAKEVLNILNFLHGQSPPVIYGDIKPSHIMLHKNNRIFLSDFGISEIFECKSEDVYKSPYEPVEKHLSNPVIQSDIYSLGATMHHLLSGKEPEPASFEPLSTLMPSVPLKLDEAVMKALKSTIRERFPSVKAMMEALSYKKVTIEVKGKEEKEVKGKKEKESESPSRNSRLVLIQGGTFQMGSDTEFSGEKPIHTVEVSPFYMDKYSITCKDFCDFLNSEGNRTEGGVSWLEIKAARWCGITGGPIPGSFRLKSGYENIPVVRVSWYGAVAYCNWLSKEEGLTPCYGPEDRRGNSPFVWRTKNGYRLPTEAEWEYACRAGTDTAYYWGDDMDMKYCWHLANSRDNLHRVGEKEPNGFGLYDMSGNVSEWCNDWYAPYTSETVKDPVGPETGQARVPRGGGCGSEADYCRSASRSCSWPTVRYEYLGFRIVRNK